MAEDIFNRFFFRSFQDAPRNLDAWGAIHASLSRRAKAFLMVSLPTDNLCPSSLSPGRILTRLPLRIICLILLATVSTNEEAGNEVILLYIRIALRKFEPIVGIACPAESKRRAGVVASC